MSFCRAHLCPQGSGPSSHKTNLSRDNPHKRPKLFPSCQQKHTEVKEAARGQGGQGPCVVSALGLEPTAAMSPVLVTLLLV